MTPKKIPSRFRSQPRDRFISCLRPCGEMVVRMELEFDHQLDIDRLVKALDLTLDAAPLLGCRLVPRFWAPYWERVDKEKREVFSFTEDKNKYEEFRHRSSDPLAGPQLTACLLRTAGSDRLLLRVNHEACDGTSMKYACSILSSIYSRLADEPGYLPEPNLNSQRDPWQLLLHIPYYAYPDIWYNFFRHNIFSSLFPFKSARLPYAEDSCETIEYVTRKIPADLVQHMTKYGYHRHSTINDLLLASFFHALATVSSWNHRTHLKLVVLIDIRRYGTDKLKIEDGICNLWGMETLTLGTDLGDTFDHTVQRISSHMRRRKAGWIGMTDCVGLTPVNVLFPYALIKRAAPSLLKYGWKMGGMSSSFSNMGVIEKTSVIFDRPPLDARILPTINYPPAIVYGVTSYNRELTIAGGTCPSRKEQLVQLFDEMVNVLQKHVQ